ncbi:MAG: tetratricopeptide repeat protein, partial [Acidobacteriota bacterium]|nr:tetratricopeptide repeat protein [Acidobacteriota bacterium]
YYRNALAKGPPSTALLNNLGNHYRMCGQPDQARHYFESLLKINPSHINANLQMAHLEAERKAWAQALKYLDRAKQSGPDVRMLRAEAFHGMGDDRAALALLDGIEKQASGDPRILFPLGVTYARIGLYDQAETDFNSVLVSDPGNFDVVFNLGRAAARARHYDRAQRAFEAALRLNPADTDCLFELGLVYAAREDYSRAVYLLAQAKQGAPQRSEIVLALARAAEDAGYYGDSALAYDEFLRLKPDDDSIRRDRARVYGYTGTRLQEGLRELAWYIQKHPSDPVGYFDLAQLSWTADPEKAVHQLSAALRLDPRRVAFLYARAWLLHRLGRTAESVVDLQAALRRDPKNLRALDQLGLAYLSLDRASEAENALRQAFTLAPGDPEVLLHLGRALMAMNREDDAQRFLDEFQKVRQHKNRDPRREPGMIELATLPSAERTRREIDRLKHDARTHPGDPELQLQFASLLLAEGRMEEARNEFHELSTRNLDARVWERAGTTLLRAHQYDLAREFLKRAGDGGASVGLSLAIAQFFTSGAKDALEELEKTPDGERTADYFLLKAKLLDAAGRSEEAQKALRKGLTNSASRPEIAEQATVLLLQRHRPAEALSLVGQAVNANPDDADLPLLQAMVLSLMDRNSEAEQGLKRIELRWPEWNRPYLVEGLIMERGKRLAEARRKFQIAAALDPQDPASRCGLTRVTAPSTQASECACSGDVYHLLLPACGLP